MPLPFLDKSPALDPSVFIADGAVVIGDVTCGSDSSFWYNTVVRGDVASICVGARVNVQDLSVVHVTADRFPTSIGDDVTIGHRAVVHGCEIGNACLIGMGAIVMDGAVIGDESMVGAGALVTPGTRVPPRSLVVGAPARVRRELTDDEVAELYASAERYVENARNHARSRAGGGQ